jgi:murein DD-endopeptidase MepM/ murein hydrolase activator NlpD
MAASLALLLFVAACAGQPESPTNVAAPNRRASDTSQAAGTNTAVPSQVPSATATPIPETPPPTLAPFPANANSGASLQSLMNQRDPASFQSPLARGPYDHFYLGRPFGAGDFDRPWPATRYAEVRVPESGVGHTGVDYGMAPNVPILAAGDGTVVWSGYGLLKNFPDPDDPYGLAVAIKHDMSYDGQRLFTVYAHLSEAFVEKEQRVLQGERIGLSGSTGQSTGTHLHFEIRLGSNNILRTRNPALWVVPPEGSGVLVEEQAGAGHFTGHRQAHRAVQLCRRLQFQQG